ncbi:MAG: nitroreductase family protein [Proteobacteria bacterium]|nr:nitroreductase family protein [Pseudomonadota bacterium]MBU4067515.1 nitroreductase family protein [Pseudomonadota bacterium]MBU4100184.1 nitroreductase family protein [Pseudomonadota bacterium]
MGIKPDKSFLEDLINKRRSIRKYKPDNPPKEWIETMLHCALMAPSPSNSQPVRFIRISSTGKREKLYQGLNSGKEEFLRAIQHKKEAKKLKNWINTYYRYSEFMFKAPILFAVGTITSYKSFSKRMFEEGIIRHDRREETSLDITVGLALKGFILKGEELGLGTCILTGPMVFIPNIEEILGIHDVRIKCFITAGFPGEKPDMPPRKSIAEIISEI